MNLEKLRDAAELLEKLVIAHEDLEEAVTNPSEEQVLCTSEEQQRIFKDRIDVLETELRRTGFVAAIEKPETLKSFGGKAA
jgi:hypothetical protein